MIMTILESKRKEEEKGEEEEEEGYIESRGQGKGRCFHLPIRKEPFVSSDMVTRLPRKES